MKKFLLCLTLMAGIAHSGFARNTVKPVLSAFTRNYLLQSAKPENRAKPIEGYVYKQIGSRMYISSFIKVAADVNESTITSMGVLIGTKAGSVWTVQIPVDKVTQFTQLPGITHIDLDIPVTPFLDAARKTSRADSAHMGINLPTPFTGKNVVVGVIDAGFDYDHPTFYDTSHATYRVRRVWQQKRTGTPPLGFAYGNEITDPYIMRAAGYDTGITSHGTHVAGIAAGSGYGSPSNSRWRGMAYESDLVFVGIMPHPNQWITGGVTDVIDGMNYIFTYASSVFKPAIANLSWGSSLGPHDGNSLFSQACDALTGPGRIFAASAGNSGQDTIHLQKTFSTTSTSVSTFVTFDPSLDAANQKTWIDVWGDTGKSFCLNVKLYNGATIADSSLPICMADTVQSYVLTGSDGNPLYLTIAMTATEYNGKPHAFLSFHSLTSNNICLTATGTSGKINMWEGYIYPPTGYYGALKKLGYPFAVSGDVNMTTSDICASHSAISVGAYVSRGNFTNISGATLSFGVSSGARAPFSSIGPTADGRTKPDITGPGMALTSGVSSYDTSYAAGGTNYVFTVANTTVGSRTYPYAVAAGTSMSCPATSGIIAMLLQMNSTLTPDSVKSILATTAITDANTGTIPAAGINTWGHGKVNAYKALKKMATAVTVTNTLAADAMDCILYPNPSHGNFNIIYNNLTGNSSVTVTVSDITGRVISTQNQSVIKGYNNISISLTNIPAGLYLTKIASGNRYNTIKTMVE